MKAKPITPYARLLQEIKQFVSKVKYRHTVAMFYYAKAKLNMDSGWRLDDLYERTKAAEQLGYEVQLFAKDDGLHVRYVKKIPDAPWGWE